MIKRTNNKIDLTEAFWAVFFLVALVLMMWGLGKANTYTKSAEVLCFYEDTAVEYVTEDGNKWLVDVDDTSDVHVGDIVVLTFNNVGEDSNIYNDEVVGVR